MLTFEDPIKKKEIGGGGPGTGSSDEGGNKKKPQAGSDIGGSKDRSAEQKKISDQKTGKSDAPKEKSLGDAAEESAKKGDSAQDGASDRTTFQRKDVAAKDAAHAESANKAGDATKAEAGNDASQIQKQQDTAKDTGSNNLNDSTPKIESGSTNNKT